MPVYISHTIWEELARKYWCIIKSRYEKRSNRSQICHEIKSPYFGEPGHTLTFQFFTLFREENTDWKMISWANHPPTQLWVPLFSEYYFVHTQGKWVLYGCSTRKHPFPLPISMHEKWQHLPLRKVMPGYISHTIWGEELARKYWWIWRDSAIRSSQKEWKWHRNVSGFSSCSTELQFDLFFITL